MAQKGTTATLCCLKTETELRNIAGGLYTNLQLNGRTFGTAAAIEDNTGNTLTSVTNVRKARPDGTNEVKADIKYSLPICGETATDDVDFDCTPVAAERQDYGYEEFYFDNHVSEKFTVREDMFDATCDDPSEELARVLFAKVQSMYNKYNRKLTSSLAAHAGSPYGGAAADLTATSPLPLKIFRQGTDGASIPQPMGLQDLVYQYQRMAPDSAANPVLIGGTKGLGAYQMGGQIYAGNMEGADPNKGSNALAGVYLDWQMPSVITPAVASNPILSFMPGAVELVEFFRYDNPNKRLVNERVVWAPVKASGTLVRQKVDVGSAILGRPFEIDMQIYYDECANAVTYTMRKDFDLFYIPQDAFCPGTNWNYIMLWNAVCAPYACADTL